MKSGFVVLLALAPCLGVPVADPVADADPFAYASDYSHYIPVSQPQAVPSAQFHAQDDIGGYQFGFQSADQHKQEVKSADGVVRGSYSYVDANGVVQTTNYISDALGFRVQATNLPVHHVEGVAAPVVAAEPAVAPVAVAPAAVPETAVVSAKAVEDHAMVASVPYAYLPYAHGYGYHGIQAAPVPTVQVAPVPTVQAAPVAAVHAAPLPSVHAAPVAVQAAAVPVVPAAPAITGSQYHAQDEAGQYSFGYNDLNSVRHETKTADGAVAGSYQYVDSDGLVQTVQYIADAAGFRVAGTNLPVFAANVPADTPEVAAAKAQHIEALAVAEANAAVADHAAYVAAPTPVVAAAPVVAEPAPTPVVATPLAAAPVPVVQPAAEGYYGAAKVYTAAPLPVSVEETPAAEGYYGAAKVYASGAPVTPIVYNTVSSPVVVPGVHPAPVAYATASPVAVASADPLVVAPAAPVGVVAPETGFQYHSQDDIGQYSFGYSDGNSGKQEIKTADGVIRGTYSYVDSDGIVQTVNYIADALGFRVGATNLPIHNVDAAHAVQAAPVVVDAPASAPAVVQEAAAPAMAPHVAYSYLPYATNYGYHNLAVPTVTADVAPAPVVAAYQAAPVVVEAAPVESAPAVVPAVASAAVPVVAAAPEVTSSQYHAQDEAGAYSYGYNSADQAKTEVKGPDGVTRGSYSYVDANGLLQTVQYISDAMGFRVAATNLPVHQVGEAVADTVPESGVEAAKYDVMTPSVSYSYLPYASNYGYVAAPVHAAAGAA